MERGFVVNKVHPLSLVPKKDFYSTYFDFEKELVDECEFWKDYEVIYIEYEGDTITKTVLLYKRKKGFEEKNHIDRQIDKIKEINKSWEPIIQDPPRRRSLGSDTQRVKESSCEAYEAIVASGMDLTLAQSVWLVVRKAGSHGMTCREIGRALGVEATTISPRLAELKNDGRLVEVEKRKCRVTEMTVQCVVAI